MMEIVIKIPEWKYKSICEGVEASKRCGVVGIDFNIHEAIRNGIPLPEHHGDLIDRDNIEVLRLGNLTRQYDKGFDAGVTCMVNRILDAPTIIDKEC